MKYHSGKPNIYNLSQDEAPAPAPTPAPLNLTPRKRSGSSSSSTMSADSIEVVPINSEPEVREN